MNIKLKRESVKLITFALKIIPVISSIAMLICCILKLNYLSIEAIRDTFGITIVPAAFILLYQILFRYCIEYKLLLIYAVVTDLLLTINNVPLIASLLLVGITIFFIFIRHLVKIKYFKK